MGEKVGTLYVGIDCAPGAPRPDQYIQFFEEMFGVKFGATASRLFGAWQWYVEITDPTKGKDFYESKEQEIKQHMDDLYAQGRIRGAEWDWKD